MRFPLRELALMLGGDVVPSEAGGLVTGFATDSNEVQPGDLFLAIRGSRVDGHEFVGQARGKGAVASLVERAVEGPYILVPNLVSALGRMAGILREPFSGPVVGITGSAGKTTTKEFVAATLSPLGQVLKTEGNRNTEYTAPLLWAELTGAHRAVVVEMAMRGFGQVSHLASFSKPNIGIVTNIGFSHMAQVGDRQGIATAKAELLEALPSDGFALLWKEDEFLEFLRGRSAARAVRSFGYSSEADCRITSYSPLSWTRARVGGVLDSLAWEAEIPAVGRHIALNAAAAILAAHCAGVELRDAASALGSAELPPMRMEIVELNGATILLDTYNASPPSMIAAIETLAELPVEGRRRAVIGEMKELGQHERESHRMVGRSLAEHRIDEVIFYGEAMEAAYRECVAAGLSADRLHVAKSLEDVTLFLGRSEPKDAVLVKGSRALYLEKALEALRGVQA